jgi:predicted nucleic acid-binding protein
MATLRLAERKAPVNDSWIAATAIARGIPVATQDDDYDGMPGLDVIRL